MSNNEINIAIAEACGAVCTTCKGDMSQHDAACDGLPDYCNDLNAMALAEKSLLCDDASYSRFAATLKKMATILGPKGSVIAVDERMVVSAPANLRAIALLVAINKEDDPGSAIDAAEYRMEDR